MASKDSTSESEHTETPPAKRKCLVYNQKYLKKWESDPKFSGWISKSDKGPMYYFCKACGKDGKAGKSELEKHAMGMKHISNVEARQKTVSVLSMPAFSGKSRQEKQVKESEIRLAAYISEHNAPFTSMEHLVPLIQAVCPDSEIAKKLKCGRTKCAAVVKNILADKSDAGNGMDVNVKEEELEVKEEAVEVKQEVIETEESGSTSRRGEKRALSRSRSPEAAPDAKKQRPEVEEVRVEDEPEVDKTVVALDWYNSDLSLVISKEDFLSAQPLTMQGFGYVWHGVRATYGFTRGRVFFEAKVEDYMPVPQLEEDEQHPHVLRVGWSVDDAGLTLGEDPFSYGYGGTGKASTNLKFKSYGRTFGKGDVLGCFLDLESEPVVMSFTVNGQHQGIAYEVSHSDLGDQALFPHIVTKNTSFRVNFGSEPAWMEPLSGYTFTGKIPLEDRVLGTQAPEKREDAELGCGSFYGKSRQTVLIPRDPNISDDESFDEHDDEDPDFVTLSQDRDIPSSSDGPPAKRRCAVPLFEEEDQGKENEDGEEEEEDHEENDEDGEEEEEDQEEVTTRRGKGRDKDKAVPKRRPKSALQLRPTTWKKKDISNPPLPSYNHQPPPYVESPQQYFHRFFTPQLIQHITFQTNLYATQNNVATTFSTTDNEICNFVAILLYMGVVSLPSLDEYWAMDTRVPQVAEIMSSKRFRLLRRTIHFNDNSQHHGTVDRFFKVRPLFTAIIEACRREPETPKQSVDEVMVGYKGKKAGNLRQYIQLKPDKWGFKLFSRASEDGLIHDMILYQGSMALTLQAHGIPLSPEQKTLTDTSQVVTVLASTMNSTCTTAIFADNYFTSLELVRYLRQRNCRYTGMAREARVGNLPLKSIQDMKRKAVGRGEYSYTTSDDDILAVRWKDSNIVTLLSTDVGVNPAAKCLRYSKETKKKEEVNCPSVIKSYNANMGGIDKSDMLVHLYKTPMKSKRWYMRLFAYCLDLSVCNAWLCYKRDCKSLRETRGLSLKKFRLEIYKSLSSKRPALLYRRQRTSTDTSPGASINTFELPRAIKGHRSHIPDASMRFDNTLFHVPLYQTRQTCKHCSKKDHVIRSNFVCLICKVHLCLNSERNCFLEYHEAVA